MSFTLKYSIPKSERSHIAHNHLLYINYKLLNLCGNNIYEYYIIVSDLYTKTQMFHNYPKKDVLCGESFYEPSILCQHS